MGYQPNVAHLFTAIIALNGSLLYLHLHPTTICFIGNHFLPPYTHLFCLGNADIHQDFNHTPINKALSNPKRNTLIHISIPC